LAVVVIALFGPGLDRVVLVLGFSSWPAIARVIRAETLSLARREFVDAARALGASAPRILMRQVLPNALPAALVVVSLNAASVIPLEAGLGFIGLGDPRVAGRGRLVLDPRRPALVGGDHRVVVGHHAGERQSVSPGELAHGGLVTRRADLVGDQADPVDTEVAREGEGTAGRLQRLEVRLADDQQRVDVPRGAATQVLEP